MRGLVIFLGTVLLIVALAIVVWNAPDETAAVLPNGIRIELLGTAVGSATFSTEKRWHKLARKVLPNRWQRWIPAANGGGCSSGTNSITVYFLVTDLSGARINQTPWQRYSTQSDHGYAYEPEGGYCSFGGTSNSVMYGLSLRSHPRRQETFKFNFLGQSNSILASFRVPNPVKGPFPEWTPLPLPQTGSNGPVTLTLESFRAGGGTPARYVNPKWKIESADPAWAKARARYATLIDATGNEAQMLSPREPAWKLRTWVHRESQNEFGPDDRLTLTNLAIPRPGEFVVVDTSATRNGVKLNMHVVSSPGLLVISNGVRSLQQPPGGASGHSTSTSGTTFIETWGHKDHFLLLEASGVQNDDEVRIRLLGPEGRPIETRESGYRSQKGTRIYQRSFTPPNGATHFTLDVILSRPLLFEFLVDPKELKH